MSYNSQIGELIVKNTRQYIGQEEIPENQGFKDSGFDKKMRNIGFQNGWAWCALFAKLNWMEVYAQQHYGNLLKLEHLLSPSALGTYHNMLMQQDFEVNKVPMVGSIVIWQEGTGISGHAGIVELVNTNNTFGTIEGNTNTNGSREGCIVARKTRSLDFSVAEHKLNLKGFIYPL
jgi:hypothetical protein